MSNLIAQTQQVGRSIETTYFQTGVSGYGNFGGGYGTAGSVSDLASIIIYLINYVAVPLIFAIAFIVFLYGIAQTYIFSHGDAEAVGKGHKAILWGVIGFAVMISIWGLVNIVANTFHIGGYYAPQLPYSPVNTNAPRSNLGPGTGGGTFDNSQIQNAVNNMPPASSGTSFPPFSKVIQ